LYSALLLSALFASFAQSQTATGTISISFTPVPNTAIQFQCSNGKWAAFGLSFNAATTVNGVGPNNPMAETGLPTVNMSWFINNAPAAVTVPSHFGGANPTVIGNVYQFTLEDDMNSYGGTFEVGTCTSGQAQPAITVGFSTNTFVVGQGFPPTIPVASGIPTLVNNFNVANVHVAGSTITTTAAPTAAPTVAVLLIQLLHQLLLLPLIQLLLLQLLQPPLIQLLHLRPPLEPLERFLSASHPSQAELCNSNAAMANGLSSE